MKISVICPLEERLSINRGGAIASWIIDVYSQLKSSCKIDYKVYCPDEDTSLKTTINIGEHKLFDVVNSVATFVATIIANLTGKHRSYVRSRLFFHGKTWIWLLPREIYSADIIHLHNRPFYALWLRQNGFKGKIILHMHNNLADYITPSEMSKVMPFINDFWFCSRFLLEQAKQTFNLPRGDCIYNGVAPTGHFLELSAKSSDYSATNEYHLVIAGRVVQEKGILEAINICDRLNRANKGTFFLSICGSTGSGGLNDKSTYFKAVEQRTAEVNQHYGNQLVTLKGHLDKAKLLAYISSCDLFLFPCQWDEPFGMVLIESMSVGTPVIASNSGGIPEIIDNGINGILVSNYSQVEPFVDEVIGLLTHVERYNTIRENAYRRVTDKFTWPHIAHQMSELLTNSVGK